MSFKARYEQRTGAYNLPIFITERVSENPPEQKTWQINSLQHSHEQTHIQSPQGFSFIDLSKKFYLEVDGAPA
jgi:hypothetical protein